jgi:hypothetical protein
MELTARAHQQRNGNFYITFTAAKPAIFLPILIGSLISFGQSTKSPLTFFSASAGAVRKGKAKALTLIASGAAAAFCFFSAAGKEKRIIMSKEYDL